MILDFIRDNDGCTKTEVIKYMDGTAEGDKSPLHAALMTTVRIIEKLITGEDKLVIMKKDPKNSQIHHLCINDQSQFNQIDRKIAEVQKKINRLQIVDKRPRGEDYFTTNNGEIEMWDLQILLVQASKLPLESDSLILLKKIVRVMLRLTTKQLEAIQKQPIGAK